MQINVVNKGFVVEAVSYSDNKGEYSLRCNLPYDPERDNTRELSFDDLETEFYCPLYSWYCEETKIIHDNKVGCYHEIFGKALPIEMDLRGVDTNDQALQRYSEAFRQAGFELRAVYPPASGRRILSRDRRDRREVDVKVSEELLSGNVPFFLIYVEEQDGIHRLDKIQTSIGEQARRYLREYYFLMEYAFEHAIPDIQKLRRERIQAA